MRRTRFIANCTDQTGKNVDIHVLDYSQDGALALLEHKRPTWTVHNILPASQAAKLDGGGWQIDPAALNEARALLGLLRPVKIRFNGRYGRTNANYRCRTPFWHDIMLKSYLTPEQANESLWHELQHAAQAERAGSPEAWTLFRAVQHRQYPYRTRPIEVEARATAAMMADCPLTITSR